MQTKKQSTVEAITNVVIGFILATLLNIFVLPLLGIIVSVDQSLTISSLFVCVGFIKNYLIRRVFNKITG